MNKDKIEKIFATLLESNPSPKIELEHTNTFTLLIATVLSAQATDKQVNKITPPLFEEVSTPKDLLKKGEEWLFSTIKSINYNKTKASNLIKAAQTLVDKFNNTVPDNLTDLQTLAGVGRKSANVILNAAFKQPTMPVDTHVFRISNKIGLITASNVLKTELELLKIIPEKYGRSAHHLLVLHGRYICKARAPSCKTCPIVKLCEFKEKNL